MGKILSLVLGLGVLAFTVNWVLNGGGAAGSALVEGAASAPKQQLDRIRDSVKGVENEQEERLDQALQKTE